MGVYWGNYAQKNPAILLQSLQTLMGWHSEGKIKPHIAYRFPLEQAPEALNVLIQRQAVGKVVVEM